MFYLSLTLHSCHYSKKAQVTVLKLADLERRQDQAWERLEKEKQELERHRAQLKKSVTAVRVSTALTIVACFILFVPIVPLWVLTGIAVFWMWLYAFPSPKWRQNVYSATYEVNKARENFVDALQNVQDRKLMQLMDPKQFEMLETQQEREDAARWQLVLMAREAKEKEARARFEEQRELSMAFAEAQGDTERRKALAHLIMQRAEDDWSQSFED